MAGSTWQGVRGREHVTRDRVARSVWPEARGREGMDGMECMAEQSRTSHWYLKKEREA